MAPELDSMIVKCKYENLQYDDVQYRYTCTTEEYLEIPPGAKLEFVGNHLDGKTDNDVTHIDVFSIVSKIPAGITKKFPNLKELSIFSAGLKDISREDLYEYRNLKSLYFMENEIEYLPGDLFADCKNLEEIGFCGNPLTTIEPNILDGLDHLKYIDFLGGIKDGEIRSDTVFDSSDPRLLKLKIKLYEKYTKQLKRKSNIEEQVKTFIQADEKLKDFRVNIGQQQFSVHKILLASRSPVLASIIYKNPKSEYVNLANISGAIFEQIVKYFYTNELPRSVNFMELYATAERLEIDDLKKYAAEMIMERLHHKNALDVLSMSIKYQLDEMKRKAFEKIKEKYPKIDLKDKCLREDEICEQLIEHLKKMQEIEKDMEDLMK